MADDAVITLVAELLVTLEAKNEKIAELQSLLEKCRTSDWCDASDDNEQEVKVPVVKASYTSVVKAKDAAPVVKAKDAPVVKNNGNEWNVVHNNKKTSHSPPNKDVHSTSYCVFGRECGRLICEFYHEGDDVEEWGLSREKYHKTKEIIHICRDQTKICRHGERCSYPECRFVHPGQK